MKTVYILRDTKTNKIILKSYFIQDIEQEKNIKEKIEQYKNRLIIETLKESIDNIKEKGFNMELDEYLRNIRIEYENEIIDSVFYSTRR